MSDDRRLAFLLARARLEGVADLGDVALAEAQQVAEALGRDLLVVDRPDGAGVVLGFPVASEPDPSRRAPRLARRELRESALRTFLVAYAMLTETPAPGAAVTVGVAEVVTRAELLFGASTFTTSALRRDLLYTHLLTEVTQTTVTLGPAVAVWDHLRRSAVDEAAQRLRRSPLWPVGDSQ